MHVVSTGNRQLVSNTWPNFFIVGAARSGTTSLYEILRKVPGVYMSPFKEPEYFAPNSPTCRYGRYYSREKNYLKLFENAADALAIGEASTSYLWDPEAPAAIHAKLPHAKIVAILRNPITRAFSDYLQDRHLRNIKLPFEQVLNQELRQIDMNNGRSELGDFSCIRNGLYSRNLSTYLSIFGRDSVKVVLFEEFSRNTRDVVNEILEFLTLSHRLSYEIIEKHNGAGVPRSTLLPSLVHSRGLVAAYHHLPFSVQPLVARSYKAIEQKIMFRNGGHRPEITPETRRMLQELFAPEVAKLESMLGRRLPWKDFEGTSQ
jgi:hypothetical protein